MEVDIDIEEHNIWENPALKTIFPDITALKQELEYENEAIKNHPETEPDSLLLNAILQYYKSSNHIHETLSQEKNLNYINIPEDAINSGAKISKRILLNNVKLKKARVELTDIAATLSVSKKYCKLCYIFFPSVTSCMNHKSTIHASFQKSGNKIAGMNKKASQKSYKSSKQLVKNTNINADNNVICFHCKNKFPSKKDIIDHLHEVIKLKFNKKMVQQQKLQTKKVYFKEKCVNPLSETLETNSKGASYIKCYICSYYFKDEKYYESHMWNKHKVNNRPFNRVNFSSNCIFCSLCCKQVKAYNKHLYNKHKNEVFKIITTETDINLKNQEKLQINNNEIDLNKNDLKKELYFQCNVCSYYYRSENFYLQHMLCKHKVKMPLMRKNEFNSKCMFCQANFLNIRSYNEHIFKQHKLRLMERINRHKNVMNKRCILEKRTNYDYYDSHMLVPKSTLFKCCTCDMVFISPKLALNHQDHVEILINWRCFKCHLNFKRSDYSLHMIQHKYSDQFNVLDISEGILKTLLYRCPKCLTYFEEGSLTKHFSNCTSEVKQSVCCSICNILLDFNIKKIHNEIHRNGNMNSRDFVTLDLVDNLKLKRNYTRTKIAKRYKTLKEKFNISHINLQNYHLYYCKTCGCFVSKIHKVQLHRQSQCSNILKYPCEFCGLILTGKSITSHRSLHRKNKELKLQDFTFYNIDNDQEINPPIPELTKCESCQTHLINKNEIRSHFCDSKNRKICPFCGIILTNETYKIHIPFHEFLFRNTKNGDAEEDAAKKLCETEPRVDSNVSKADITIYSANQITEISSGKSRENNNYAYRCEDCLNILDSYDDVIEHCQVHLVALHVDNKIASSESITNVNTKILSFDRFNYGSQNDEWIKHLFGSIPRDDINRLLSNSIYKYETRMKMEVSQEGNPAFTVYKCERCQCIVDCESVLRHTHNCKTKTRKHNCVCGISFINMDLLNKHLDIHTKCCTSELSLRIISFNKPEHNHLNSLIKGQIHRSYIMYTCRNCEGVVDKTNYLLHVCNLHDLRMCAECGLLIYNKEYDTHIDKHRNLKSFTKNNFKVILLGMKSSDTDKPLVTIKSSFNGVVSDYSFYQCTKCEVCVKDFRDTKKHYCLVGSSKAKCMQCELYFEEVKLKGHMKMHSNDQDFTKGNIITVNFNPVEIEGQYSCKNNTKYSLLNENFEQITLARNLIKIYKCVKCDLHFLNESSAREHIKKSPSKTISQQCTKCGFSFSPKTLFNHMLEHHSNKKVLNEFEIRIVTGTFKKQKIYKCSKCFLHFTTEKDTYDHNISCSGVSEQGEKCKSCGVKFHFSNWLNHERMHEKNVHVEYETGDDLQYY